jgi:hypothetical protein
MTAFANIWRATKHPISGSPDRRQVLRSGLPWRVESYASPLPNPLKRNDHTLGPSRMIGNDASAKEIHCDISAISR